MTSTKFRHREESIMTTISFVGLGAMGSRVAARLLDGNSLYGTNRTPAKAEDLISRGMIWCDTPHQVAEAAEVVFSMVSDDAALRAITHGPEGILAGLTPGKVLADMSAVGPRAAAELAGQVETTRGARMVSAPVSGRRCESSHRHRRVLSTLLPGGSSDR
jgi:3-hydroxyisobutyrate dehydrogenase-like beta-hydroxyacid dehydrogenase